MKTIVKRRSNLQDVLLFVEVARNRSFSRAAWLLDIPMASVSRRIALLEESLGVKLLVRSTWRVELTAFGMVYFERCVVHIDRAQAAHESFLTALTALEPTSAESAECVGFVSQSVNGEDAVDGESGQSKDVCVKKAHSSGERGW